MLDWLARGLILLLAPLLVLALGAGGATRALRYSHTVLRLGFAAVAGLRGCHPILILARDSRIARIRVHGSLRAIGALGYGNSILALSFAAIAGLSRGHSVRVLVGDSRIARIRIDCRGGVAVPAHRLTSQVGDAILRQ